MAGRKFAVSRDGNEAEIVEALKKAGCTVQPLANGDGRPDLLVGQAQDEKLLRVLEKARAWRSSGEHSDTVILNTVLAAMAWHADTGRMFLVEVKNPAAAPPGKGCRIPAAEFKAGGKYEGMNTRLRPKQAEWHKTWATPVHVVETPNQALTVIGAEGGEQVTKKKQIFDPGLRILDIIDACDGGKQVAAIDEELAEALRHTAQLGGGKVKVTMTTTLDVKDLDTAFATIEYKIARPARKATVGALMHLDTVKATDEDGRPTTKVESVTIHARNPRQIVMEIKPRTLAVVPDKEKN